MTGLTRLRPLGLRQTCLLLGSVLLLPPIDFGLRLLGYARLRRLAERFSPFRRTKSAQGSDETFQEAKKLAGIVSIAARRGLFRASCLRRSMLVWWLLRQRGIQSEIRFGVRLTDGHLEAHAWVEHDGIVLDDTEDVRERYTPLDQGLPPTTLGL